ncbi:MAG: DNA recombination/repair protein RecA, partial [Eubacterium sp.]|nr:DNA recombination/repair protein RecA [Eubacterium sp.]
RKAEQLKNGSEVIGSRTKAKIVKNKVAPPFKSAEFDIMYGTGISKEGEIVDMAVEYDIIHKGGSWFSYGDRRLGQGRDNIKNLIKNDPEFSAELEVKIKDKLEEIQAESAQKYRAKAAPMAKTEDEAAEEKAVKTTRAAARAKLDIAVEDDED